MVSKISLNELKNEIDLIRKRYPKLKDDSAFVFWFLSAYLVDDESIALKSLTGKEGGIGGEKNIDAIFIDERAKQCNIIQGKFHITKASEKINDVTSFAYLGNLPWEHKTRLESFYSKLDPIALYKFREVVSCVKNKKYKLNLYYVTTGKCSETIVQEAKTIVRNAEGPVDIYITTLKKILNIFRDYLDDITPHVPPLKLRIISEGYIQHKGLIHRFDSKTKIESWVLSVCGKDIGNMYEKVGKRLFAKNIRGWLGDTDINESISTTIKREPQNFWYYNNGVTIVCEDAKRETQSGEDVIIVDGAQIINGQQTTRTLNKDDSQNTNVLVKIIKIPRDFENGGDYDRLVNSIVRATNWQNYILPSDLVSNDYIQVYLEREFRKINYQYIRKKMSKSEAKTFYGMGYYQIDKRELAQAVGACVLEDPTVIRKGRERLFEDPHYKIIFQSEKLSFYLSKYWLMKIVGYISRGYPSRAYPKWIVLNFIWKNVSSIISSGVNEKRFRYICERWNNDSNIGSKSLYPLNKAIENAFRSALKFHRLNRGKGEEAKDLSTFFQSRNLDEEFAKFWTSSKNTYRDNFNKNTKKFERLLNEIDIENI